MKISGISPVTSAPAQKVDPELRKAAVAFEAVMLRQLIGTMRKLSSISSIPISTRWKPSTRGCAARAPDRAMKRLCLMSATV
ncbi:hypothetical protein ACFSAG_07980 [Sphingorhabdus buctiana]|jgi:hypothetical protein|uniref:Flagellar protein FlgJ N-terminal domain-containing protein n=1 Tax=Sphingorhabdus buctiana TaxID=1508805 RepID=A0ABW4MEM7_9SPHN